MIKRILSSIAVAAVALPLAYSQAAAQDKGPITLVMGTLEDAFFATVKAGADQAAKDFGVEYTYIGANLTGPDLARALETAIATNPAGLAVGNWFPDAENPVIIRAVQQGIPVVAVNAAPADWDKTGAFALIGQSDYEAGELGGKLLAEAGSKNALCVSQAAGAQNLEQRCAGFTKSMEAAGGKITILRIPFEDGLNPTKYSQAVQGAIAGDKQIDSVFALGSPFPTLISKALEDAGRPEVKIGGVDVSGPVLQLIADGKMLFTIDQQPYLQGYYAVSTLAQNAKHGLHLVGHIRTGPAVIDQSSAANVIAVAKEHRGVRGAL